MNRPQIESCIAVACWVSVLVVGTGLTEGVSTAQRVLTDLAMPIGLLWLAALAIAVYQFRLGQRAVAGCFAAIFLGIGFLFSAFLSNWMLAQVEHPLPLVSPLASESPEFRGVVVLGGGAGRNYAGHAELNGAGERIAMAAKLWHAGKVDWIIATGTGQPRMPLALDRGANERSSEFMPDDPAEVGHELLVALGVPAERVFRCGGQNTAAEMNHLAAMLPYFSGDDQDQRRVGVVTSAFHLPRAVRLARSNQLDLVPIAAGTMIGGENKRGIGVIVPTVDAGTSVARAAKEILAYLVGR